MDMYQQANPAVIIYILLQKVRWMHGYDAKTFRDLASRGLEASRYLLQEWLLCFLTHYLAAVKKWGLLWLLPSRHKQLTDTTFRTVPKLRILPKYVFSCFNATFLSFAKARSFALLLESISTISYAFTSLLILSRLPPLLLSRFLYPQLSTYAADCTLHIPRLNLSLRSLLAV